MNSVFVLILLAPIILPARGLGILWGVVSEAFIGGKQSYQEWLMKEIT